MKGNTKALTIMNGHDFSDFFFTVTTKFLALHSSEALPRVNFQFYFCAFADLCCGLGLLLAPPLRNNEIPVPSLRSAPPPVRSDPVTQEI